ncbi:UNVERIFIED_CONTAM: hypothetical protein Sindi_2327600, partial [Sesamum indicum]
ERLQPSKRNTKGPDVGRGRREKEKLSQPLLELRAPLLIRWKKVKGKGRIVVHIGRGKMMFAFITVKRGIERGSAHNSSPIQVVERSRRLRKDEIVLRLGDARPLLRKSWDLST